MDKKAWKKTGAFLKKFIGEPPKNKRRPAKKTQKSVSRNQTVKMVSDIEKTEDKKVVPDVSKSHIDIPEKAETTQTEVIKPAETKRVHNSGKEFMEVFKQLTYEHSSWEVWKDFVTMFACSLSNPVDKSHYDEREKLYLKLIKKYKKSEQALFPQLAAHTVMALEDDPEQDFLGKMYMSLNLGNRIKGQFFTPYHICELMADIVNLTIAHKYPKRHLTSSYMFVTPFKKIIIKLTVK